MKKFMTGGFVLAALLMATSSASAFSLYQFGYKTMAIDDHTVSIKGVRYTVPEHPQTSEEFVVVEAWYQAKLADLQSDLHNATKSKSYQACEARVEVADGIRGQVSDLLGQMNRALSR